MACCVVGALVFYCGLGAITYTFGIRRPHRANNDVLGPQPSWWCGCWRFITMRYDRDGSFLFGRNR